MSRDLIDLISAYTQTQTREGPYATPIADVLILRSDEKNPPVHRVVTPAICIVAQGAKSAMFGDRQVEYCEGEALIVSVTAPSLGRVVQASPHKPCLVLAIALDPSLMREMAERLNVFDAANEEPEHSFMVTDFSGPLSDCAVRIVKLFDTPQAIGTIYPLIMQEMYFWLLTGPHGRQIARLVVGNGVSTRVKNAVEYLRQRFSQTLRLDELADVAQLSSSAFHRQFKVLTSLTPLQYQKRLRLIEAKRLMTLDGMTAERAAFQVGYTSQSQFSREYVRMFGDAPKRHLRSYATPRVPVAAK